MAIVYDLSAVRHIVGDTKRLNIPDEVFDAVVAHTLVSHVDDPLIVVKEAGRVVRRGGTVGIFDGDYASLTFDHPNPTKGKFYDEALISAIVTSPRVMRQMPRLLTEAGLEIVASFQHVLAKSWSDERQGGRRMGRRVAGRFAEWGVFRSLQLLQLRSDTTLIHTSAETPQRINVDGVMV